MGKIWKSSESFRSSYFKRLNIMGLLKTKPWYESLTVWSAILLIILGLAQILVTRTFDPDALLKLVAGFIALGLRRAIDEIPNQTRD